MTGFLGHRSGWVVMTNSDLGSFVIDEIVGCLTGGRLRGELDFGSESLKAWIGEYRLESNGMIAIGLQSGRLRLELDGHPVAKLTVLGRHELAARGLGLTLTASGRDHLVIRRERDGVEVRASRVTPCEATERASPDADVAGVNGGQDAGHD